jgi:methionine synthase I (cobalamin-dependent)
VELAGQIVAAAGNAAVIVQPNAGSPRTEQGRTVYDARPEQMADTAGRLLQAGVRIVGGCCGTEPAHLAAMSQAIRSASKSGPGQSSPTPKAAKSGA